MAGIDFKMLASLLNKREGTETRHPGTTTERETDKGRTLKQWSNLLRGRYGLIQKIIDKSGGGSISTEDFLGLPGGRSVRSLGTRSKDLLGFADRLLKVGGKIEDDPAYGDRIISAEKAAAKTRRASQQQITFNKTFFNPRASRSSMLYQQNQGA